MEPIYSAAGSNTKRKKTPRKKHSAELSKLSRRFRLFETDEIRRSYKVDKHNGLSAEDLLDLVHEAGQQLLDERTYSAAQHYRKIVGRFLHFTIPSLNTVEVHDSCTDFISRKRYYLLTEVNQAVNRLIDGVLKTQNRQMDILARLQEIEGMLVNLLH